MRLPPATGVSWLPPAAAAELVKSKKRRGPLTKGDRNERREQSQGGLQIRPRHQGEKEFITPRIHLAEPFSHFYYLTENYLGSHERMLCPGHYSRFL